MKSAVERITLSTSLESLAGKICAAYGLGDLRGFSLMKVGYEDCNIRIEAEAGVFLAKVFSKLRQAWEIERYVEIMQKVMAAGVAHPELMRLQPGGLVFETDGVSLVLMRFIEGNTFYDLDRVPDENELLEVVRQAVKISRIDYRPEHLFDSWAVCNIRALYNKVKDYLNEEELRLAEFALENFEKVPSNLPHCLTHGDLTKANLIRSKEGEVYVVDFSVANWSLRINELGVLVANLMYDGKTTLLERCERLLGFYEKEAELSAEEKAFFYPYAIANTAMEFLGAVQEKFLRGNDGEETQYWLNLGKEQLRACKQCSLESRG